MASSDIRQQKKTCFHWGFFYLSVAEKFFYSIRHVDDFARTTGDDEQERIQFLFLKKRKKTKLICCPTGQCNIGPVAINPIFGFFKFFFILSANRNPVSGTQSHTRGILWRHAWQPEVNAPSIYLPSNRLGVKRDIDQIK